MYVSARTKRGGDKCLRLRNGVMDPHEKGADLDPRVELWGGGRVPLTLFILPRYRLTSAIPFSKLMHLNFRGTLLYDVHCYRILRCVRCLLYRESLVFRL